MKYLFWLIGLFAAAVAVTVASNNAAYVLLVVPPYRIELSLVMFIILLVLAFLIGYMSLRLMISVVELPSYVKRFRSERAQVKTRELMDEVLGAFFEGRYAAAEKAAVRAMELGDPSALHPIIAARCAHELREYKRRDAYLATAENMELGDSTMRLLATTKFMLDQRDPGGALETLQELRESGVKDHAGALTLELKAQQQSGNWDDVLKVVDQLEKRASIDAIAAEQIRQQAWLGKLRQQQNLAGLTACMKSMPADFKRRRAVVAAAARALIRNGGNSLALPLLADSLNAQWDSELMALYGDCLSEDVLGQIEQAEKWLNQHKQDAGLLLTLGKLCMYQKLWGKAQSYLDASLSLSRSHAAYTALGQLSEVMGKSDEAAKYHRQAMEMK